MPPILGLLAAFGPPFFHGISNIIDGHLSNKIFSNRLAPLIFLTSITGLILLPIVCLLDAPKMLVPSLAAIAFLIALTEVGYMYPYYYALRKTDTSVVASLFSLGRAFVPVFAFLIVGERLVPVQYLGIALIVSASLFLTLDFRRLRFNAAFFLMLLVTVILALQGVLFKYLFEAGTSWGTSVVWVAVFEAGIASAFVLFPGNIASLRLALGNMRASWKLFAFNEFLGWAGNMASYFAVFLIPVSIAKAIGSTQSIFVLLTSLFVAKRYPHLVQEQTDRSGMTKKAASFVLMIVGVILMLA